MRVSTNPLCAGPGKERIRQYRRAAARRDGEQTVLRFTRDWSRVLCLDPEADTQMLEALEIEIGQRLRSQPADHPKPILDLLERSLSNGCQITETKAYLVESFLSGLEDLMRRYVDSPRRERKQRRGGRAAIVAAMRTHFEAAGVWTLMRKTHRRRQIHPTGRSLTYRLRLSQQQDEDVPGDLAGGRSG